MSAEETPEGQHGEVFGHDLAARGMGISQEAPGGFHRIPEYDRRTRDHYWVMSAAWKVDPIKAKSGDDNYLDMENLVTLQGPGCYYCGLAWTPHLARRRCAGDF